MYYPFSVTERAEGEFKGKSDPTLTNHVMSEPPCVHGCEGYSLVAADASFRTGNPSTSHAFAGSLPASLYISSNLYISLFIYIFISLFLSLNFIYYKHIIPLFLMSKTSWSSNTKI